VKRNGCHRAGVGSRGSGVRRVGRRLVRGQSRAGKCNGQHNRAKARLCASVLSLAGLGLLSSAKEQVE
jgi:hypothetical protein